MDDGDDDYAGGSEPDGHGKHDGYGDGTVMVIEMKPMHKRASVNGYAILRVWVCVGFLSITITVTSHAYMHIIHTCKHITHTCLQRQKNKYIHTPPTHIHTHTSIHTYTHTYIHTYIHTHTHITVPAVTIQRRNIIIPTYLTIILILTIILPTNLTTNWLSTVGATRGCKHSTQSLPTVAVGLLFTVLVTMTTATTSAEVRILIYIYEWYSEEVVEWVAHVYMCTCVNVYICTCTNMYKCKQYMCN
jgi:hypothetical protein